MGTRQKKAVKGDVTGVVVTPITAAPPTVPATVSTARMHQGMAPETGTGSGQ
jgi:hypothetical protein